MKFALFSFLISQLAFAQNASFNTAFWKTMAPASGPPTSLSLTHTPNNRNFTVSWSGGAGNDGAGGCKLQYLRNGTTWTDLSGTFNCDVNATNVSASLPSTGSWTNNFNGTGVQIQIVRISDSASMGVFPQRTTCNVTSGSAFSTPTIDENCNHQWNDSSGGTAAYSLGSVAFGSAYNCASTYDGKAFDYVAFSIPNQEWYTDSKTCSTTPAVTNTNGAGPSGRPRSGTAPFTGEHGNDLRVAGSCGTDPGLNWSWKNTIAQSSWGNVHCYYSGSPTYY